MTIINSQQGHKHHLLQLFAAVKMKHATLGTYCKTGSMPLSLCCSSCGTHTAALEPTILLLLLLPTLSIHHNMIRSHPISFFGIVSLINRDNLGSWTMMSNTTILYCCGQSLPCAMSRRLVPIAATSSYC